MLSFWRQSFKKLHEGPNDVFRHRQHEKKIKILNFKKYILVQNFDNSEQLDTKMKVLAEI